MNTLKLMKNAYGEAVKSVVPHNIIKKLLKREGNKLIVTNQHIYEVNYNVHIFGFGKAVLGMVKPIQRVLTDENESCHIMSGILSVPCGILDITDPELLYCQNYSKIKVSEGAKNNIPDSKAYETAKEILESIRNLQKDDLAIILISGGGSALLPYPTSPLTLDEKITLIRSLSMAGADIVELNTVRKAISETKGGKLVQKTKARILSLILSDVIDSPLDIIASGPTVPNSDTPSQAFDVINKYGLVASDSVKAAILTTKDDTQENREVNNVIIGDNLLSLSGCKKYLEEELKKESEVIIASSAVQGNASEVARALAALCDHVVGDMNYSSDYPVITPDKLQNLHILDPQNFLQKISKIFKKGKGIFLLFGGETTVQVSGDGKGGRNQELVLAFSIYLRNILKDQKVDGDVYLLSAGTDGLDGPTPAAGGVTYWNSNGCLYDEALAEGLKPEDYLRNNDSYSFLRALRGGHYLLSPGHTGTNVMDILILAILPRSPAYCV